MGYEMGNDIKILNKKCHNQMKLCLQNHLYKKSVL
jgi:hypothetical protein